MTVTNYSNVKKNCKIVTCSAVLLCPTIFNKSFLFVRFVDIGQGPHRGLTVLKEGGLFRSFKGSPRQHGGPLRELGGPQEPRFGDSWMSITGSWKVL